jgi:hypothetical protein
MTDDVDPDEAAAVLRVVAEVDAGHIEAESWQRGYLRGALDTRAACPDVYSLSAIIRTLGELTERGVMIRSRREGIDYSTPTGRMVAGIFAALAEYEHSLINERAEAPLARPLAPAASKPDGPARSPPLRPGRPGSCAPAARASPTSWPPSAWPDRPSTGRSASRRPTLARWLSPPRDPHGFGVIVQSPPA